MNDIHQSIYAITLMLYCVNLNVALGKGAQLSTTIGLQLY